MEDIFAEREKPKFGLNSNFIKLIAVLSMTIDHVGYTLYPGVEILRIIGRLAFPIFAYFIAEGCTYTSHKLRYFLTVFLLGVLCQIVYYIAEGDFYLGILITFSLSILLIYGIRFFLDEIKKETHSTKKTVLGILWIIGVGGLAFVLSYPPKALLKVFPNLTLDYLFFGVLTPVFVYLAPNKLSKLLSFGVSIFLVCFTSKIGNYYALLALLPIALYNGERGKLKLKYFFYIYYPLHLAIIYGIQMLFFS